MPVPAERLRHKSELPCRFCNAEFVRPVARVVEMNEHMKAGGDPGDAEIRRTGVKRRRQGIAPGPVPRTSPADVSVDRSVVTVTPEFRPLEIIL